MSGFLKRDKEVHSLELLKKILEFSLVEVRCMTHGWLQIQSSAKTTSNFKTQTMSFLSALDENDDLKSLETSSENSAIDLETDFEKYDDGIGFSAPARLLKTTTHREMRTKSDMCVTLHT